MDLIALFSILFTEIKQPTYKRLPCMDCSFKRFMVDARGPDPAPVGALPSRAAPFGYLAYNSAGRGSFSGISDRPLRGPFSVIWM